MPRLGKKGEINPAPFLEEFRSYAEDRVEDQGEIRLVAWVPRVVPGEQIEPKVDRHRGFTAVVEHLRNGPPPAPDGPRYNYLARDLTQLDKARRQAERSPQYVFPAGAARRRGRPQPAPRGALPGVPSVPTVLPGR